jgi:hypothetical protein
MLKIKDLLADPKHHCKGCCARDDKGRQCDSNQPAATQWCLYGAMIRVYAPKRGLSAERAAACVRFSRICEHLHKMVVALGYDSIGHFNDSTDHQTVLQLAKDADV